MINTSRKIYPFYIMVDLLLSGLSFFIAYAIRYRNNIEEENFLYFKGYFFVFLIWYILTVVAFNNKNLYSTDRSLNIPSEILKAITSLGYVTIIVSAIIFYYKYDFFSRQILLLSFILLCISLSSWRTVKRLMLRKLIREGFHNINILVVGTTNIAKIVVEEIKRNPWWGFKIVGFLDDEAKEEIDGIPVLGKLKDFIVVAKKHFIDEVIITMPSEQKVVSQLIKQIKSLPVGIRAIPENFGEPEEIINISNLGIIPLLTYKERKHHPAELFLKRFFDLVVSLTLLILLSPLFVVIAILIKLDSPGPAFYTQKRAGLKGRIFNLYKFRSMIEDADKLKAALLERNEIKDGVIFKIKNDPRITKLGIFLRKSSLDELPQLVNVVKGNMSLIGPRPAITEEVGKYNYSQMVRLSIRPGITGLSQIKGRSNLTFRKWVKWDLWYINNWSFMLDLKILWWTIPAVFKKQGAY